MSFGVGSPEGGGDATTNGKGENLAVVQHTYPTGIYQRGWRCYQGPRWVTQGVLSME